MIYPNTKYLAITEDKITYSVFDDLCECKVVTGNYYICKINNIYSSITNPICEVYILMEHINVIPSSCNYKLILGSIDLWQKITNNRWAYVQSDITRVTIKCKDNMQDHEIFGSGILTVPNTSKGYHNFLQLIPSNQLEIKLHLETNNITSHIMIIILILLLHFFLFVLYEICRCLCN